MNIFLKTRIILITRIIDTYLFRLSADHYNCPGTQYL